MDDYTFQYSWDCNAASRIGLERVFLGLEVLCGLGCSLAFELAVPGVSCITRQRWLVRRRFVGLYIRHIGYLFVDNLHASSDSEP